MIKIDCPILDRENAARFYRNSAVEDLLGRFTRHEFSGTD